MKHIQYVVFNYITNGIYGGLIVSLTAPFVFWIIFKYYLPAKEQDKTNKDETPTTPTIPTNKECFDSSESKTTIHSALS